MRSAFRELRVLGARQLAEIADEARALSVHDPVVCHGAPSLGSVILSSSGGFGGVLTGEDLVVSGRESDLLWVVGELIEMSFVSGSDSEAWTSAINAFVEGYGGVDVSIATLARIRILLHLHDFTAYVGWPGTEFATYLGMLTYLAEAEGNQ